MVLMVLGKSSHQTQRTTKERKERANGVESSPLAEQGSQTRVILFRTLMVFPVRKLKYALIRLHHEHESPWNNTDIECCGPPIQQVV